MKDHGKISSSRSLFLITSAVAVAAAGGAYFKSLTAQNQSAAVRVDVSDFAWMGKVSVSLESPRGLAAPTVVSPAVVRVRPRHRVSRALVPVRHVADKIQSSAAAPDHIQPAPIQPTQAPTQVPTQAPNDQPDPHAEMRDLFKSVRGQFYSALNDRVDMPSAVVVVAPPAQVKPSQPVAHARLAMTLYRPRARRVAIQDKLQAPAVATQVAPQPLVFAPKPDYAELQRLSDLIALGAVPMPTEPTVAIKATAPIAASTPRVRVSDEKVVTTQAAPSWVPSLAVARAALAAPRMTSQVLAQSDPSVRPRAAIAMNSQAQAMTIPSEPRVVEAFAWNEQIQDVSLSTLTTDGWKIAAAPQHWPTLHWNPKGEHDVALPSYNTAQMLARLANVSIQPGTGIVVGRIPEGWSVEFTGRSESVVMLGEDRGMKGFAFMNAAPGAATLTLRSADLGDQASVALVVLPEHASFMDLSSITQRDWSGRVLDASSASAKGLRDVSVSVLDQPQSVTVSGKAGRFEGGRVMVVGDYPVMIETTARDGFKHRYRVDPSSLNQLELFRMSESQLQGWISQLEGGVSPDSGLIVGASPGLVHSVGDGRVFPKVHALLGAATLEPETYTVTESGELHVGSPLEISSPRFVGVQVPEGPVVVQAEDQHQDLLSSQWIVAQPGVVNVVDL